MEGVQKKLEDALRQHRIQKDMLDGLTEDHNETAIGNALPVVQGFGAVLRLEKVISTDFEIIGPGTIRRNIEGLPPSRFGGVYTVRDPLATPDVIVLGQEPTCDGAGSSRTDLDPESGESGSEHNANLTLDEITVAKYTPLGPVTSDEADAFVDKVNDANTRYELHKLVGKSDDIKVAGIYRMRFY